MRKAFIILIVVIGNLVIGGFLLLALSFSGGIEGVIHGMRPLPDFSKGEPAEAREKYMKEFESIDKQLVALTEKQYQLSFSDYCERSQYNWKVKSDYLASCTRGSSRLYLTDKDACSLLPVFKSIINAEHVNNGGCAKTNPVANYNDVTRYEGGDTFRIAVTDRRSALKDFGLYTIPNLYNGGLCPYVAYCEFKKGDYDRWQQMLNGEAYNTAIIFEYSKSYYRK
jgi:hypothetical protein